jgi:hypothetical protein
MMNWKDFLRRNDETKKKSLRIAACLLAHMRFWYFGYKCRAVKLLTEQLNVERTTSSLEGKYWAFQIIFCTTFLIKAVH